MKKYLALIGIIILAVILYTLDLGKIATVLFGINLGLFAVGVVLDFCAALLKAKKWQLLVNVEGKVLGFAKSVEYFLIGFFLSVLTPGRVGDLARALYLKRETKSVGAALSTVILDRLIDVFMLFGLGFVAIVSFTAIFGKEIIPIELLLGIAAVVVVIGLLVLWKGFVGFFLEKFFAAFVPERFREKLLLSFDEFYGFLEKVKKRPLSVVAASAVGFVTWAMAFASSYIFLLALGIEVPFYFVVLIVPIVMLLDLLPISISGIGTRDAALIFLFSLQGIGAEEAVAFSFIFVLSGYWIVAIVGWVLFMKNSISLDFAKA